MNFGNKLDYIPSYNFQPSRMEKLARDKHSSLIPKFVNYEQKSFVTLVRVSKVLTGLLFRWNTSVNKYSSLFWLTALTKSYRKSNMR